MMQPLSSGKRNLYFYGFVALFALVIPFLILYSEGYRFGTAFSLVKTGGIYLYSDIADTTVYVDGALKKETGLFLRNTFIQNLPPDSYTVRVEKNGYRSWEKYFDVSANMVTDAKVFMIREMLASTTVPQFIPASATATTTAGSRKIANPEYADLLKLVTVATTTKSATSTAVLQNQTSARPVATSTTEQVDQRRLKPAFVEYSDTYSWLDRGDVAIEWVGSYERTPFYFCIQGECMTKTVLSLSEDILEYAWLTGTTEAMVVRTASGIFVSEVDSRSAPNVYKIHDGPTKAVRVSSAGDIVVQLADAFVVYDLD